MQASLWTLCSNIEDHVNPTSDNCDDGVTIDVIAATAVSSVGVKCAGHSASWSRQNGQPRVVEFYEFGYVECIATTGKIGHLIHNVVCRQGKFIG